jgi:hypothetical protein
VAFKFRRIFRKFSALVDPELDLDPVLDLSLLYFRAKLLADRMSAETAAAADTWRRWAEGQEADMSDAEIIDLNNDQLWDPKRFMDCSFIIFFIIEIHLKGLPTKQLLLVIYHLKSFFNFWVSRSSSVEVRWENE